MSSSCSTPQDELAPNAAAGRTLLYRLLHQMGVLGHGAPPTLRALRTAGQPSTEELIDRYRLSCRPIRDLLVEYLRERQPALDYNSLESLANYLGKLFWSDLERHHPGIDSLHLSVEVAEGVEAAAANGDQDDHHRHGRQDAGGRRADQLPGVPDPGAGLLPGSGSLGGGRPGTLGGVGGALPDRRRGDQPARRPNASASHGWTPAPANACPSCQSSCASSPSGARHAAALLDAARQARPGETFNAAGTTLVRSDRRAARPVPARSGRTTRPTADAATWCAKKTTPSGPGPSSRCCAPPVSASRNCASSATTAWSNIACPRPARSSRCCRSSRPRPTPNACLVVSPELADVLSAIILRVSDGTGAVPLVARLRHPRTSVVSPGAAAVPTPSQHREPGDRRQHGAHHPHRRARPHRPRRPRRRKAAALHAPRLPSNVHHRRHDERPPTAHRPGHRRAPRHQRHDRLQGRLPRRSRAGPPRLPRPATITAAQRRIPHPHRRGMARVPRSLRATQGLHRHLRSSVLARRASTNTPASAARCCGPTRQQQPPPRRDPRQPHRPHRRSRTRRLARRSRRTHRSASPAQTKSSHQIDGRHALTPG